MTILETKTFSLGKDAAGKDAVTLTLVPEHGGWGADLHIQFNQQSVLRDRLLEKLRTHFAKKDFTISDVTQQTRHGKLLGHYVYAVENLRERENLFFAVRDSLEDFQKQAASDVALDTLLHSQSHARLDFLTQHPAPVTTRGRARQ